MNKKKLFIILVIAILVALFIYYGLGRYFTLAALKSHQAELAPFQPAHQ